jgi:hypothetical protein
MQKKLENPVEESGAAFACAILLLNVLTLTAVGGIVWLLLTLVSLNSPLNIILREMAWR